MVYQGSLFRIAEASMDKYTFKNFCISLRFMMINEILNQ